MVKGQEATTCEHSNLTVKCSASLVKLYKDREATVERSLVRGKMECEAFLKSVAFGFAQPVAMVARYLLEVALKTVLRVRFAAPGVLGIFVEGDPPACRTTVGIDWMTASGKLLNECMQRCIMGILRIEEQ